MTPLLIDFQGKNSYQDVLLLTCYIFSLLNQKRLFFHLFEAFLPDWIHLLALSMIILL